MAGWSKPQWQKHIRTLVSVPANVVFTNHAPLRMRQRHISRLAAFEILKKGVIRREPEPNLRRGTLECRLDYYFAGRNLALVAAVDTDNHGGDRGNGDRSGQGVRQCTAGTTWG